MKNENLNLGLKVTQVFDLCDFNVKYVDMFCVKRFETRRYCYSIDKNRRNTLTRDSNKEGYDQHIGTYAPVNYNIILNVIGLYTV